MCCGRDNRVTIERSWIKKGHSKKVKDEQEPAGQGLEHSRQTEQVWLTGEHESSEPRAAAPGRREGGGEMA